MKHVVRLIALLAGCLSAGCAAGPQNMAGSRPLPAPTAAQARNAETVRAYLAAADPATARACLAGDNQPSGGTFEWDYALHPHSDILHLAVNDDTAVVVIHETNDFARLLEFPGWDGTLTYTFNDRGKIAGSKYVPAPNMKPWAPYLEPALPWLREHRAADLAIAYPGGRLKQDAAGARLWVQMLTAWRAATGRPPVK